MKEQTKEWKPVVGYEGLYEVSRDGDVRSVKTQRVLKSYVENLGYPRVTLYDGGIVKNCKVHRLVAMAFIDNPEAKSEVNHINGVKTDNKACNLEWATRAENIRHAWDSGLNEENREGMRNKMSIRMSKQVVDLQTGIFYDSLKKACIATNCNYNSSAKQIINKYKTQRFQFI